MSSSIAAPASRSTNGWPSIRKPTTDEAALWMEEVLRALAFAHDAGVAHLDPQFHTLLVNERGQIAVMALSVAHESALDPAHSRDNDRAMPLDPSMLRAQRSAAERDVLACGLLLHRLLAGEPALGVADTGQVIARLAPHGREFVRLPWTTPQPIPEPLRAIVNRSTAGQMRLRYRNARTFLGALNGWREALSDDDGRPGRAAARPPAHRRPPAGAARAGRAGAAGHGDREPAHRRDRRASAARPGARRSSCCAPSTPPRCRARRSPATARC